MTRAESGSPLSLDILFLQITDAWQKDNPDIFFEKDFSNIGKQHILVEHAFGQAIINLLDNAADASPSYVGIKAESTSQILTIQIIDKGEGVADEISQSLGEAGVTNKTDGLGLGLFLAKSVISRMGGTLKLENAKDKGTIAVICLPIKRLTV